MVGLCVCKARTAYHFAREIMQVITILNGIPPKVFDFCFPVVSRSAERQAYCVAQPGK